MVAVTGQRLSPEEYLQRERRAETKSEYVDGVVLAMAGASPRHVLITANIVGELHQQLKRGPCRVYSQDLRVQIAESGTYVYPDVVVVCDEPQFASEDVDALLNPTLIVEVLAESTEAYDRGLKFARYRQCALLKEYVLVAHERVSVERFSHQGAHWVLTEAASIDDVMELPSIGCTLALRDVYDKVEGLSASQAPGS